MGRTAGSGVCTSNIRLIASEVPLGEQEGLPKACVANCDNIRVVPKLSLTKRAGELAPERWVEVITGGRGSLGLARIDGLGLTHECSS